MAWNSLPKKQISQTLAALKESRSKREAASKLGICISALYNRITNINMAVPGTIPLKKFDPIKISEILPNDSIEIRRLRDRIKAESLARHSAEGYAAEDKTIREAIFGLVDPPLTPPSWSMKSNEKVEKVGEVVILMISDVHMGESIKLDQMGGVNSFNPQIAKNRLQRLFFTFIKF